MSNNSKVTILDLFDSEEITEKSDGNFRVVCPSCGSNGFHDYGGMVLFVETDTAYCHNSCKWFTLKEAFALKKGIIACAEGRDSKNE